MKQLIFTLLVLISLTASADKTTRKGLKVAKPARIEAADTAALDTIALSPGMITLAGYDKPLRSNKESIYASNATRRAVIFIEIEITYFDESGRQLHKRTVSQHVDIPTGETRQLTFSSWDKQRNMYYTLSGKPRTSNGTPYTVTARATRAAFR